MKECCNNKTKHRDITEYKALENRLNRIEGQIRGLKNMLSSDAYCTDILIQVSAVKSALDSFSKVLLSNHINTCVKEDIKNGNAEVIDELVETINKMIG